MTTPMERRVGALEKRVKDMEDTLQGMAADVRTLADMAETVNSIRRLVKRWGPWLLTVIVTSNVFGEKIGKILGAIASSAGVPAIGPTVMPF